MNNIVFKGVSSTALDGLLISELPPISKPAMRTRQTAIDGRDGAVIEELGYSSYNKSIVVGLYGQYDINKIIKYFSGEGELVFSNEPDKVYKATIVDKIDFERLVRYRKAKVTFLCQPFKYKKDEQNTETETATASGTEMSFESGKANIHALNIYGKTTQSGTPTQDAPIHLKNVSGANLLKKVTDGNNATVKDGVATQTTADTNTSLIFKCLTYNESTLIAVTRHEAGVKAVGRYGVIFEKTAETTRIVFGLNGSARDTTVSSNVSDLPNGTYRLSVNFTNITQGSVSWKDMMINEGTTAIAYRPFTEQECVLTNVEGGNLIDMASFGGTNIDAVTNVDGTVTLTSKVNGASTTSAHLTGKLPAGTYTLKVISGGTLYWQTNATDYSNGVAIGNNKTFTYDGTSYLRILVTDFSAKESRVYTVMLNKGSKPLPFQPYTAPQQLITTAPNGLCGVPVSSGGNYTDATGQQWLRDEIDFKRGVLIKRTHTITFKGTETISPLGGTGDSNAFFYAMDANVISTRPHTIDNEGFSLCSHFEPTKIATSTNYIGHQVRRVSTGTQYRILFRPEGVANMPIADFVIWLKANNPTVTYALEIPQEIPLSAEDIAEFKALQTSKGTTTISSEDDAYMEVEYFKPFEVFNEGLEPSRPLMLLKGSGTVEVSVNGIGTFSYTFPEGENEVYIDSEKEDAYLGAVLKNRNMNGEFPILQPNKNTIEWSGYVESIKILPRSRWL